MTFALALLLASLAHADHGHAPSALVNLGSDAALEELEAGNARYIAGKPGRCVQEPATRQKLATGQAPNAIILSCSDSRVPPELVFDQGLGQVFAIRVAGNVLSQETIASIEYAIAHLGTRLIVVLGHESCGAVKAALATPKGGDAGSPSLNGLIAELQKNIGAADVAAGDKTLRAPVKKNVDSVAKDLAGRSPIVRDAVKSGKVRIARAIYGLASGKAEFW